MTDPFKQFTPWPTEEREVTAVRLIKYYWAVVAFNAGRLEILARPTSRDCGRLVDAFAVATTLEALCNTSQEVADETARAIWRGMDDGGHPMEMAWERLREHGLEYKTFHDAGREAGKAVKS